MGRTDPEVSSICGKAIPAHVITLLDGTIMGASLGAITVTVQDCRIVQIERTDRILVPASPGLNAPQKMSQSSVALCRRKILQEIRDLAYGQVTVKIQDGLPVQVEKTEKIRLPRIEGLDGEGI
ncbi:MAG: DUF2292 domain-containing protein [Firmicutes bacterium]|nr:DUF2292 domain-containing protein [Bacillota bacterium]